MKADLHVHSSYSDGNMSIFEIVEYAKEKGIDVLGITDLIVEKANCRQVSFNGAGG